MFSKMVTLPQNCKNSLNIQQETKRQTYYDYMHIIEYYITVKMKETKL